MKTMYLIGNWKMKITSLSQAKKVFLAHKKNAAAYRGVQTIVCPPFLYVNELNELATGSRCVVGSQDVFHQDSGAFTGEVSASMISERGIGYSIVGHSERRAMGETDEVISEKIRACLKNHITPILCIGELERSSENTHYDFVKNQLLSSLSGIPGEALGGIMFAYEPVWAISSSENQRDATPEDVREMAAYIRKVLSDHFELKNTDHLRVLYGGSANKDNAEEFLAKGEVVGLLVGSASIDPDNFSEMMKIANDIARK